MNWWLLLTFAAGVVVGAVGLLIAIAMYVDDENWERETEHKAERQRATQRWHR